MAQFCPQIIFQNEESVHHFYNWFTHSSQEGIHPIIVVYAIQSMQHFFISLERYQGNSSIMNTKFVEIINICILRILDQRFIAGGYIIPAQDSLNDVVQYCDNQNLK